MADIVTQEGGDDGAPHEGEGARVRIVANALKWRANDASSVRNISMRPSHSVVSMNIDERE